MKNGDKTNEAVVGSNSGGNDGAPKPTNDKMDASAEEASESVKAKNSETSMPSTATGTANDNNNEMNSNYLDHSAFLYQNRTTGAFSPSCKLSARQLCRILCRPPKSTTAGDNGTSNSTITPETYLLEYDTKTAEYSKEGWKIAKSIPVLQQACASWYYTTTTTTTSSSAADTTTDKQESVKSQRQTNGPVSCRQLADLIENGTVNVKIDLVYSPDTATSNDKTDSNNSWCTIQNNPQLQMACQAFFSPPKMQQQLQEQEPQSTTTATPQAEKLQEEYLKQQEQEQKEQQQVQGELEAFLASTADIGNNLINTNADNHKDSNNNNNGADHDDFDESYESDGGTTYVKNPLTGDWIHHALALQQKQQYQEQYSSKKGATENHGNNNKSDKGNNGKKRKRQKKSNFAAKNAKCWIYVTGLPIIPCNNATNNDAYEQEVSQFFSKVGIIDIHPETQKPKIKLYRDKSNGSYKGDASICYARPESVELALTILDDSQFSSNQATTTPSSDTKSDNNSSTRITVQRAKFEQTGDTYESRKHKISNAQRKVAKLATQQMMDWDNGEFNGRLTGGRKGLRIIVLRNMFQPAELLQAMNKQNNNNEEQTEKQMDIFFSELEGLIRKECEGRFGQIEKITIFSNNPQGIVIVKFAQPGSASDAVKELNGEEWDFTTLRQHRNNNNNNNERRKIYASFWDGVEDFTVRDEEKEQEEMEKRHEEFGQWLESQQADQLPDEFKLQIEGQT